MMEKILLFVTNKFFGSKFVLIVTNSCLDPMIEKLLFKCTFALFHLKHCVI